jgi:hypothetical protein
LALSDFQLPGLLKSPQWQMFHWQWRGWNGVAEEAERTEDFYTVGFNVLVKWWDKCINVGGGYIKK